MNKVASVALEVEELVIDGQPLVRIHIGAAAVVEWAVCLQLLADNLVEAIRFHCMGSGRQIEIRRTTVGRSNINHHAGEPKVVLDSHSLDYVRHFFLRYYRDGAAEVNHLDVELEGGGYLTITVDEHVAPVSSDEVKRRLGL